jgi:hypothetical protein
MADTPNPTAIIPMEPDYADPFAPDPKSTRLVECLHCDQSFAEQEMLYGVRPDIDPSTAYWWRPTPGCDGRGMGFDIHAYGEMTGRR